jgi:hypothetical protein
MTTALTRSASSSLRRILRTGLALAVVDAIFGLVTYVLVLKRITAPQFFQGIASSLLGDSALNDGLPAVALGALLHLTVATSWSAVYFVAIRRLGPLALAVRTTVGKIGVGIVFGAIIWLVMALVVVPLTRAQAPSVHSVGFLRQLIAHMLLLGPTITLVMGDPDHTG